ncbi:hypothetical protein SAMD00019534_076170 [Acytostelium subglobosum LB1]|uniref:hypothetical protein n=1 Tax=Acytostelium subglobosum LB1 TaxID=1410327 RepID=UPI0006449713|nr:hypothetical protein SAMD00019534_076170 [Acytostelium subglobosum LB1]GAM24442.1 hypothetical protein SAMD00019534_076170 [Acytostelium subglobosum LB1]|eukprot:XP_012752768.1 hypothetical protein SAMD00019534_076170 [Acytostelium subglobosum LB1]
MLSSSVTTYVASRLKVITTSVALSASSTTTMPLLHRSFTSSAAITSTHHSQQHPQQYRQQQRHSKQCNCIACHSTNTSSSSFITTTSSLNTYNTSTNSIRHYSSSSGSDKKKPQQQQQQKDYDYESVENDPFEEEHVDREELDRMYQEADKNFDLRPWSSDPNIRDTQALEHIRAKNKLLFPRDYEQQIDRELNPRIKDLSSDDKQLGQYQVRGPVPLPEDDELFEHQRLKNDWTEQDINDQLENQDEDEIEPDEEEDYEGMESEGFDPFLPARPKERVENLYNGVAHGHSKRKDANAVALVRLGTGELTINGKTLTEYFGNCITYKDTVLRPLVITETIVKWDVEIRVSGGGIKGQAEAISRALALAISNYDLGYRMALRFSGLLKHDIRRVERKKPGQLKARKKFPLVKR